MNYDPLTDDILMAVEMAQERARTAREPDGTFQLTHLLSGFDLHPSVMAELVMSQVENHTGRLKAGADPGTVVSSAYVGGMLVGLFLGEVRQARKIAAGEAAA